MALDLYADMKVSMGKVVVLYRSNICAVVRGGRDSTFSPASESFFARGLGDA